MIYQDLAWPPDPNPYCYNYDHSIIVNLDPGPNSFYFWAIQFWFIDGTAGYMGLQTDIGDNNGSNLGKGINLAIWNATDARPKNGAKVRPDTDGQPGKALYVPYVWQVGVVYRFRIWELSTDNAGIWWMFAVQNTSSEVEIEVGSLKTPLSMQGLNHSSVVWTEYYGPQNDSPCNNPVRKEMSVTFLNPVRNNNSYLPTSTSLRQPICSRFEVIDGANFSASQQVTQII